MNYATSANDQNMTLCDENEVCHSGMYTVETWRVTTPQSSRNSAAELSQIGQINEKDKKLTELLKRNFNTS